MNAKLAIAIVCFIISAGIIGFWNDAFGEPLADSNSVKHFGVLVGTFD